MKNIKKLLAIALVVAIGIIAFVVPGYAINVYADKDESYKPTDELSVVAEVDKWTGFGGYGEYPTRPGAILVTEDALSFGVVGHAALVVETGKVIHAMPNGVVLSSEDWREERTGGFVGLAVRDTTYDQDVKAKDYCLAQKGKPYNFNFTDTSTTEKFYCSQLIWKAYKTKTGVDLSTDDYGSMIGPYELIRSDETFLIYAWNWSRN